LIISQKHFTDVYLKSEIILVSSVIFSEFPVLLFAFLEKKSIFYKIFQEISLNFLIVKKLSINLGIFRKIPRDSSHNSKELYPNQ